MSYSSRERDAYADVALVIKHPNDRSDESHSEHSINTETFQLSDHVVKQ